MVGHVFFYLTKYYIISENRLAKLLAKHKNRNLSLVVFSKQNKNGKIDVFENLDSSTWQILLL